MADEATIKSFLVELGYKVDETSSDRFIAAIAGATKRVMELGAAIEGAVLGVIGFTTEVASELSKLYFESERTKTSAENLRAFAFAMSNIGVSAEEAHSAMREMGKFLASSPGAMPWLQQLFDEFAGGAKATQDVTEDLKNLGTAFVNMGEQQAIAWGTARGLSYEFIEALLHHTKEIQGFENTLHGAYARVGFDLKDGTDKSVKFMQELRTVWSAGLEPLIDKIAVSMMPQLTRDMEQFRQLILNNSQQIEAVALTVIRGLMWIGDELLHIGGNVATFVGDIIKWFQSLNAPTQHLIELIGGVTAALYLLDRNPFIAIISGLLFLISDYEDWKKGAAHFIDWDTWGPEIKHAIDQFLLIAGWIDKLITGTIGWQHALEVLALFMAGKWLATMMLGLGPVGIALAAIAAATAATYMESQNQAKVMDDAEKEDYEPIEFDTSEWGTGAPTMYRNRKTGETHTAAWFDERFNKVGGPGTEEQQRTSNWLMDFFQQQGKTKEQAAGITGNFAAESSFDPYARNEGHLGMGQWDAERQADFRRIYGHSVDDRSVDRNQLILEQAQFALHEMHTTRAAAGDALNKQTTVGGASDAVGGQFEQYGNDPAEAARRRGLSEQALKLSEALHKHAAPQPAPTAAAPDSAPTAAAKGNTVTNTQHISNTINTTADPNAIVNALNRVSDRANADIVRQTRSAII